VALLLYYALMVAMLIQATKAVAAARGTVLYPLAIFVAMYAIWQPIHYTLVFGDYGTALPDTIVKLGLLRLVIRMLETAAPASQPHPAVQPAGGPTGG
jgi:hypothetical protein